jgi:nitrogen regulatory protein P-II 2
VRGYGRQRGHKEVYRGAEYTINYVPKLKLEIAVDDDKADELAELIMRSAQTGKIGDGKIFIFDLTSALRIRTGETGSQAL